MRTSPRMDIGTVSRSYYWLSLSPGSFLISKNCNRKYWSCSVRASSCITTKSHGWGTLANSTQTKNALKPRNTTQQTQQDKEDPKRTKTKGSNNSRGGKRAARGAPPAAPSLRAVKANAQLGQRVMSPSGVKFRKLLEQSLCNFGRWATKTSRIHSIC